MVKSKYLKLRILFYVDSLRSGGKERRIVELIKGLSLIPNVKMAIVLTNEEVHYKEIFRTGIDFHYTIRRKGVKKDPKVFLKFYQIAKMFSPDIIHVWENMVAIYSIPTKYFLGIPMVNNEITSAPEKIPNKIISHRLSFPFSDLIISNTNAGLKAYKAPASKSKVIYNGFDFKRISNLLSKDIIREKFGISTTYVVGMVASFSDKKDYKTYIEAANLIIKNNDNISFLCVGSGDDSFYKKMVNNRNSNRVFFLGKQNDVESIMNICDIGVLMTNNENHGEGISNALLEFCALSKPVIANYNGGNGELILNNETGYLIAPKDSIELSKKIKMLILNENNRHIIGNKASNRVETCFSLDRMIDEFYQVYLDLV